MKKLLFLLSLVFSTSVWADRCANQDYKNSLYAAWSARMDLISAMTPATIYYDEQEVMNHLIYAVTCNDMSHFDTVITKMDLARASLTTTNEYLFYYYPDVLLKFNNPTPMRSLGGNYRIWLNTPTTSIPYPYEVVLNSSQFLYPVTYALKHISSIAPGSRTTAQNDFLTNWASIVMEHYKRYVLGTFDSETGKYLGVYGSRGWACKASGVYVPAARPLVDVTGNDNGWIQSAINKSRGDTYSYCNLFQDSELWIMAGTVNMLAVNVNIPGTIPALDLPWYQQAVSKTITLLRSKFSKTKVRNLQGTMVPAINYDLGAYDDYKDHVWAGYRGARHPEIAGILKPPGDLVITTVSTSTKSVTGIGTKFLINDIGRNILFSEEEYYRINSVNPNTQVLLISKTYGDGISDGTYTRGTWGISPNVHNVGWDSSHAARFVHTFNAFYDNKSVTGVDFPTDSEMQQLINQYVYGTFNKNLKFPKFSVYLDGRTGWYRVNYTSTQAGYDGWDGSSTMLIAGWGLWGRFNTDVGLVYCHLEKMLNSTEPAVIAHVTRYYGQAIWSRVNGNIVRSLFVDLYDPTSLNYKKYMNKFIPQLLYAPLECV